MTKFRSIKGTHDILPEESFKWRHVENVVHKTCAQYGYQEIRTPIFEQSDLFSFTSAFSLILSHLGWNSVLFDLEKNPKTADEIEKLVREKAGMIARELEGNPSPKEKISKED